MDNETKLSAEQINSIKEELSQSGEEVNVTEFIDKHLNASQRQAVTAFMSDPEKIRRLLDSPVAKKLMERFSKEEKE